MRIVILCGGSGSRLWPESRQSFPKQFIPLFDGKSLLDLTIERVLKKLKEKKPIFICNKNHGFLVKESVKRYKLDVDILLEPEGKNTCAAIYLAAKFYSEDENLLIMPSDHLIPDVKKFNDDISYIEKNLTLDYWVTLGIKPERPSEAYGYIQIKEDKKNKLKKVLNFVEKPNIQKATKFLADERYFWNAGIFISKSTQIIKSIQKYAPDIAMHCDKNFAEMTFNKRTSEFSFSAKLFSLIPSESLDYAVMEHEKNVYLFPYNSNWSDVGSWDSIIDIYKNNSMGSRVIQVDSQNNFVKSKKRLIAMIGVEDLIIIDSDNATLISKKNHSEKVKQIVGQLIEKKFDEANEHSFEYRPWGKFENLFVNKLCKVKKLTISPKKRLSLQYHNYRSEHWLVVNGIAKIHLDGKNLILNRGESLDIPEKTAHYIKNIGNKDLIIIETQLGSYFGEDDIIRLDDPYSR